MSEIVRIILITALAGVGGTGLGGFIGAFVKKDSNKMVSLLLSGAGGVMLGVVCFDLIPGALNPGGAPDACNIAVVALSILAGYGIVFGLNRIIDRHTEKEVTHFDKDHPKTADDLGELIHSKHYDEHRKKKSGLFTAGIVMACAIALHNMPEGIVIGTSYAKDITQLAGSSGLVMAIVMGLHNIPEGMAVSVPLISGGDKRGHAILLTALSGAPTILGAVLGYFIGTINLASLSISLGFASGAMLYVVFGELLPEAFLALRSKLPAFGALVGIMLSLIIVFV